MRLDKIFCSNVKPPRVSIGGGVCPVDPGRETGCVSKVAAPVKISPRAWRIFLLGGPASKEYYDCAFGAKSRSVRPVTVEFNAAQRANMQDVTGFVAFGDDRRLTNWHPLGMSGDDVPGFMECHPQLAFRQPFSISALFHPGSPVFLAMNLDVVQNLFGYRSQGRRAMAVAFVYPEMKQGKPTPLKIKEVSVSGGLRERDDCHRKPGACYRC